MNSRKIRLRMGLALLGPLVAACGGGSSSGGGNNTPTPEPAPPPETASFGALKPAESATELLTSLQFGLSGAEHVTGEAAFTELTFSPGSGDAPASGDSGNFTTTNLQEVGVDEADILKYDGEVLYTVQRGHGDGAPEPAATDAIFAPGPARDRIHLLRTDPVLPTAEEVSVIELEQGGWLQGLYLHSSGAVKSLIGIGGNSSPLPWQALALDYYWQNGTTSVTSWDVTDANAPSQGWRMELDGSLLATRRIDSHLYVVTRYSPAIDGLVAYPETPEQEADNQALIEATPLEDLLPDYRLDSDDSRELLSAEDCYLPNPDYTGDVRPVAGGSLITITAIDLEAPEQQHSLCLNTNSSGFYASRNSLYITGTERDDNTLIHKVSLDDQGPGYRGTGQVPGYIGTQSPSFLMSESGDDLRVVSSLFTTRPEPLEDTNAEVDSNADYGPHRLTILRENAGGTALEQLAQIPNASYPQNIGKPGEQVYAARFLEQRAYIVTFEVIDPLYVVDLSTPTEPRISGELELPGFSTLLQPLGENLLLGVGNEVPPEAQGLVQGIKVALFDVADINAPLELGSEVIGKRGSSSPALYDHHALTLQTTDQGFRAALPVVRHAHAVNDSPGPSSWYDWSDSGLYQFDIDPATGSLALSGSLIIEERNETNTWPVYNLHSVRSVIHDDALFLVLGQKVWSRQW